MIGGVGVASSKTVANLAESVATVAIAGLAGPLGAMGAAGAKETVKHAKAAYLNNAATRELHQKVEAAVLAWAANEIGDQGVTARGLGWAAGVIRVSAPDWDEIARLDFDAGRVAAAVIGRGRFSHPGWHADYLDRDVEYAVAERAIKETYTTLIKGVRADGGAVLAAVRACQADIQEIARSQRALVEALVGGASAVEVMAYLRARIRDWDDTALGWLAGKPAPSILERRLRAEAGGALIPADEALHGQRMLVVLGAPGAGKTWLAKRYARLAAQDALVALLAGADVADVEIPVYTTWDMWNKQEAGATTRQGLVAASFASGSGHSDLGGQPVIDRLKRTLTASGQPVLAVVDSLDEASSVTDQSAQLRALTTLDGWRVAMTSRPGAWQATTAGTAPAGARVVSLLELDYPQDVEAFLEVWFAGQPDRGRALRAQIRGRADLRRSSRSPLLLTFLCILTDDAVNLRAPLPVMRRALYQDLLRSLVEGAWANNGPGLESQPDTDECLGLLTRWAWQAVESANTPVGLGDWADTFTPADPMNALSRLSAHERRAVDNIAPRVSGTRRRFVHRTLLEHLVAEHIATLDTDTAATILLPHLWYDPDWQIAAPAAIAAHNQNHPNDPGALLAQLLDLALPLGPDPARKEANKQIDELLLGIAAESQPGDWPDDLAETIHTVRVRTYANQWGWVVPTARWRASNDVIRQEIVAALPRVNSSSVARLVGALADLDPSPRQRDEARDAVLAALRSPDSTSVATLLEVLMELDPSPRQRDEARDAVLAALRSPDSTSVARLLGVLMGLVPGQELRPADREALTALLEGSIDLWEVARSLEALVGLYPGDPEWHGNARAALITLLLAIDPRVVAGLVGVLEGMYPGDPEVCGVARDALLAALPGADPRRAEGLVQALLRLDPDSAQRGVARDALLAALPGADSRRVEGLVQALLRLDPDSAQRGVARDALLAALPGADPWRVEGLVQALLRLDPDSAQRGVARDALVAALLNRAKPQEGVMRVMLPRSLPTDVLVAEFAEALVALDSDDLDLGRGVARDALVAALRVADPQELAGLVGALVVLDAEDLVWRGVARDALVAAMPVADPGNAETVVWPVVGVDPEGGFSRHAPLTGVFVDRPIRHEGELTELVLRLRQVSEASSWIRWLSRSAGSGCHIDGRRRRSRDVE